jgi:hypothetical protein
MQRLCCLCYKPPPQYVTVHPVSPISTFCVDHKIRAGSVIAVNASELNSAADAGVVDEEGNIFSAQTRTASHQRLSFLASTGLRAIAEINLVELKSIAQH